MVVIGEYALFLYVHIDSDGPRSRSIPDFGRTTEYSEATFTDTIRLHYLTRVSIWALQLTVSHKSSLNLQVRIPRECPTSVRVFLPTSIEILVVN